MIVFVGPKGENKHPMFTKMLQRAGLAPDMVEFHDTYSYHPGKDHTKVILLGDEALRWGTGEYDLFRWRGRLASSNRWPQLQVILPTLLPSQMLPYHGEEDKKSPLNHKPTRFQGIWVWDVHKLMNATGLPVQPKLNYHIDPGMNIWSTLVDEFIKANQLLSFDIETAYKMKLEDEEDFENDQISAGSLLRISFSHREHSGVSVTWGWPYLDGIIHLLTSSLSKLGWNLNAFDIPRLREEGINVDGEIFDGMDAWHMLRSEQPMGLEYVTSFYGEDILPWKHLNNSNPGLYSCHDSNYALRNFQGIAQDLKSEGMWDLFMRHSVKLMPILAKAGRRGCLVDVGFSKSLEAEMQVEKDRLEALVQPLIPKSLFPRKRYKTQPDEYLVSPEQFELVAVPKTVNVCSHCDQIVSNKSEHFKGGKKNNPCKAAGAELSPALRETHEYDKILAFNMNSGDQVKSYINHFGHPMGKNRKTDADSSNAKHLKKLRAKYGEDHPFYGIKMDHAKVAKTISTYVYHRGMDEHNVVHGWFNNSPTTWRLAQRAYNFTNVGKRETNMWAVRARNQLIARPGHCFVNADSTSIEAVIVGHLIGDENYIKIANKSIHAWLCCADLGIEFTDENVEWVKSNKKDMYNKFKVANYLLSYGGDPYLMHMEEPETFPTLQSARDVKDRIFNLIPKLAEYQDLTRKQAKKEGVLTTPWGYKHYFYDVFTFKKNKQGVIEYDDNGNPKIRLGQDSKTSLAFRPQNIAAGFGRETLLAIGNTVWGDCMCANCFVHDGYTLESPWDARFDCANFLIDTLTRPVVELGGLRFGCEVEISAEGGNWGDYNDNPKKGPLNLMGLKKWKKVEV